MRVRAASRLWGNRRLSYNQPIALVLCALFLIPAQLPARQMPGEPSKPAANPSDTATQPANPRTVQGGLKILVLEGQNAVNSITNKTAISPVIQVLDLMEQPVEGAIVAFEISPAGPGGSFNNTPIATVKTDYSGQATAPFKPNNTAGAFTIKVTASFGGQTVEARIRQTNDLKASEPSVLLPPKPWYKDWKWWAVIGAGAGAGVAAAILLTDRNNTSTITIAPGTVVVGGPR